MRLALLTILILGHFFQGFAQPTELLVENSVKEATVSEELLQITSIRLSGNKRTRPFIVMREVPFREGDFFTPKELTEQLTLARNLLMNTALFVDVVVEVDSRIGDHIGIHIQVKERWYLFPTPYFKLIDRNFNQWWVENKRSLERVNYGLKFIQNNLTGRNDNLNIWLIDGYNRQVNFKYDLPFIDKKLTKGFSIYYLYSTQREVQYKTSEDRQKFIQTDGNLFTQNKVDFTFSYRPDVKWRHYWGISLNQQQIADTVLALNPNFYPSKSNRIEFIDFKYTVQYFDVDYIPYASKGIFFEGNLYRRSLSRENGLWSTRFRVQYSNPLSSKAFYQVRANALARFPLQTISFIDQRMIGFGDLQMRGLDYHVVDGTAGVSGGLAFHFELFKFVLKNPIRTNSHDKIPFRFLLRTYGDLGYVRNNTPGNNALANTLLRTAGIGIDMISIYDFVLNMEYSFNQLGTSGLFLHTRYGF
jgi:outer membrane protein assembly factor BamA